MAVSLLLVLGLARMSGGESAAGYEGLLSGARRWLKLAVLADPAVVIS
jgi:hypothetical protein